MIKLKQLLLEDSTILYAKQYKKPNEVLIASNQSYYSWEDTFLQKTALLMCNLETKNLRLIIVTYSSNSGINSYEQTAIEKQDPVGTLSKPDLGKIRTILSNTAYKGSPRSCSNYKKNWTTPKNVQKPVADIIKTVNNELNTTLKNVPVSKLVQQSVTGENTTKLEKLIENVIRKILKENSAGIFKAIKSFNLYDKSGKVISVKPGMSFQHKRLGPFGPDYLVSGNITIDMDDKKNKKTLEDQSNFDILI